MGDGNYSDFETGETRRFALEIGYAVDLKPTSADTPLRCTPVGGEMYDAVGEVTHVAATEDYRASLLDFGPVRAYTYYIKPQRVGDRLEGRISLDVDPFFYFEEIAKQTGVPPIIYTWRIDKIELDVTPMEWAPKDDPRVIEQYSHLGALKGSQPDFRVRVDDGPDQWRTIDQTRWGDDDDDAIAGGYRLHCTLLPEPPRHEK